MQEFDIFLKGWVTYRLSMVEKFEVWGLNLEVGCTLGHTEAHWGRVEVLRHAGATNWSRAGPDASLLLFTLLTFLSTTCFVT